MADFLGRPPDTATTDDLRNFQIHQHERGASASTISGSELASRDIDLWAYQSGVALDFSRPGKPTDNVLIEAFNSKLPS